MATANPLRTTCAASRRAIWVLAFGAAGMLAGAPRARADVFHVNQSNDVVDMNLGDGVCDVSPSIGLQCTLRAAVQESRLSAGGDNIVLPHGTITLSIDGTTEQNSATGDLDLSGDILITGQFTGPRTVIQGDAGWFDRIFETVSPPGSEIVLQRIEIRGGNGFPGGGLNVIDDFVFLLDCLIHENEGSDGAGIHVDGGELEIDRSSIVDNHASGRGGGISTAGEGELRIERSLIAGNTAVVAGGGIDSSDDVELTNSTVSNNTTAGHGGGLHVSDGHVELRNVTVVGNASNVDLGDDGEGGGIWSVGGFVSVGNSVIAGNVAYNHPTKADCAVAAGSFVSTGYTLIEVPCTGVVPGPGDQSGVDPKLGPLADYGGLTKSHRPNLGSPLIDAGSALVPGSQPAACAVDDQRGEPRPQDGNGIGGARCDIGAVELGAYLFADGFESGGTASWN